MAPDREISRNQETSAKTQPHGHQSNGKETEIPSSHHSSRHPTLGRGCWKWGWPFGRVTGGCGNNDKVVREKAEGGL